jgi:hypothetical protein
MRIEPLTSDSPYLDAAAAMLTTTFSREYMFVAIAGDSPNKDEIARLRYRHILLHGVLDLEASVAVDESKDSKEDDSVLGIMIVKKPDIDISKTCVGAVGVGRG